MKTKKSRIVLEIITFVILILIDQITKSMAVKYLMNKPAVPIINNVLELYFLPNGNSGAAFGMLQGHQLLFMVIALIVVVLIGYILVNIPVCSKYNLLSILLVLIAAGGVGNMIDRVIQNYVVDFIYFSIIDFPIFNVADIYVSVSTVILVVYLIFIIKEDDYKEIESAICKPIKRLRNK